MKLKVGDRVIVKSWWKYYYDWDKYIKFDEGDIAVVTGMTKNDCDENEKVNLRFPYNCNITVSMWAVEKFFEKYPYEVKPVEIDYLMPSPVDCAMVLPHIPTICKKWHETLSTKLIINKPAVILFKDGKKYVVKLSKGDRWDEEKGVAFALLKSVGIDYKKFKKILKAAVRQ